MAIERKTGPSPDIEDLALQAEADDAELDTAVSDGEGDIEVLIDAATTEDTADGGMIVDFSGAKNVDPTDHPFNGDLCDILTEGNLTSIGHEVIRLTDDDDTSRGDWKKSYANGLKLLGLQYENRTEPWENACGAFHPMLLESVIRFNAEAMSDLFPSAGPVKTKITGTVTEKREKAALRIQRDLNNMATRVIKGFRDETDMMMFNLPLAGTVFRGWRFDEKHKRPAAYYILPEHLVMPYSAASLDSAERFAVILHKTKNWIEAKMASGFYREVEVGQGSQIYNDEISEERDRIQGRSNSNLGDDQMHKLYECHINYFIEDDPYNSTGEPLPYVITVDSESSEVLSIRRDWREDDETCERVRSIIQHKYMPGFGPYGIGLINILGSLTESATSILRQLVDAGTLSNLPAGYKAKGMRIKDDSDPIGPGEWRDVEVTAGTLRENFFPLPYKEPSTVLYQLLSQIVDEGRRIGSVADMKVADMSSQNMPVGTTLAIIERSMKVMSAVQQRLYESFTQELNVLFDIVKEFMLEEPYPFELSEDEKQANRVTDYGAYIDIIPVADPNATTMAQRIMQMQAITQLMQQNPAIYDQKEVHRAMIRILGSEEADKFVPVEDEVMPLDPVTENMNLLNMKPVKAGIQQNHQAHIAVHMSAIQDPKMQAAMANNPASQNILAAAASHIQEHIAFEYRKKIEEQLGVPLPPPGQPLPEDIEYQIAELTAQAAQKLLGINQMEQQAQMAQQAANDPVVQNQTKELEIKARAVDTKARIAEANLADKSDQRRLDALLAIFKEMSETERSTLAVQVQKGMAVDRMQLEAAQNAADLNSREMVEFAKLLMGAASQQPPQVMPEPPPMDPGMPMMPPGMPPMPGGPIE